MEDKDVQMVDLFFILVGNIAGNYSQFGEFIVKETNILKCLSKSFQKEEIFYLSEFLSNMTFCLKNILKSFKNENLSPTIDIFQSILKYLN